MLHEEKNDCDCRGGGSTLAAVMTACGGKDTQESQTTAEVTETGDGGDDGGRDGDGGRRGAYRYR